MAFKIAGSLAFKDAVARCRPTLLEPMVFVEVVMPEEFAGAVMGDLSSRRGRPQGMEPYRDVQKIKPRCRSPRWSPSTRTLTGGRGSCMELIGTMRCRATSSKWRPRFGHIAPAITRKRNRSA
jgi:elongation factor G